MTGFRFAVAALLAASLTALPALADTATMVSGTWALTVETSAGTGSPTLVLEQHGVVLAGVYTGRFGPQPVAGRLNGNAITFSFDVSGPMGSAKVTYAGAVDGDTMSGTMRMGSMTGGTFSGVKQSP